jgi:adenylate kinase family enzyme
LAVSQVTVGLLRSAMVRSGQKLFLVDGFPRNLSNLEKWEEVLAGDATVGWMI